MRRHVGVAAAPPTAYEIQVSRWRAAQGDKTLRLDYDLNAQSAALDLGGYEGQWASDIFGRFACTVHVFEPVPQYAEAIRRRFARNPRIKVYPFALGGQTTRQRLHVAGDSSSLHGAAVSGGGGGSGGGGAGGGIEVEVRRVSAFLDEAGIGAIDLMKVNIEGAEYELLDDLLTSGVIRRVRDLQVQFHDVVPDAARRMADLQQRLAATHAPTWQFPFVWENWRRIDGPG